MDDYGLVFREYERAAMQAPAVVAALAATTELANRSRPVRELMSYLAETPSYAAAFTTSGPLLTPPTPQC